MSGRRLAVLIWGGALTLVLSTAVAYKSGLRINLTASAPEGLWMVSSDRHFSRGDYVEICPPDTTIFRMARSRGYLSRGSCPGGYEPLFKPITGLAGDAVIVSSTGIRVNGMPVTNSIPLAADEAGRPLSSTALGSYVVSRDEIWFISSLSPNSFDSRYFGPIPTSDVQGRLTPLWTWGGKHGRG